MKGRMAHWSSEERRPCTACDPVCFLFFRFLLIQPTYRRLLILGSNRVAHGDNTAPDFIEGHLNLSLSDDEVASA